VLSDYGVTIAIEPLNRFETYFLNTAADSVRLCDEINHPHVGILFDTFHANIEEKDIGQAYRTVGRHLKHVHTCENDRGTPGSGHVEWPAVFAALRDIQYDGWLTIESFGFAIGEISAAAAIWRDLASSPDVIAWDGLKFLKQNTAAAAAI
jgi:D-psicose/D-tagatose/L-ribulose 3-epimerase